MNAAWYGLLANFAVVFIFISLWAFSQDWMETWRPSLRQLAFGLLMGVGTVVVMKLPFQMQPGQIVDLRTTFVAVAGLFGGPLSGCLTGVIAAGARLVLGGAGAFGGVVAIVIATAISLIGHRALAGKLPTVFAIFVFAIFQSIGGMAGLFTQPPDQWLTTIETILPPFITLIFVSIMMASLALLYDSRRREVIQVNRTYRAIIEALPDSLNAKDVQGRFIAANPATARLMRAANAEALIGRTDFDFYPLATAVTFRKDDEAVLADGNPVTIEQRVFHIDGSDGWLATLKAPLHDTAGRIVGLITHNRDITDRRRLEAELAESRKQLSAALANMADALVMFDRDARIVFCNERYTQLFPLTADLRVPGALLADILRAAVARGEEAVEPDRIDAWIARVAAALRKPSDRQIQLDDGRWLEARNRPTEDGGCLIVFSDITQTKVTEVTLLQSYEEMEVLAKTDALTGVFNRRAFDQILQKEFMQHARAGLPISLMLIDVDHFKAFNDAYGHPVGDECLRTIGRSLTDKLRRPGDIAARYGGEEFAAILPNTTAVGAFQLAERLRHAIRLLGRLHSASDKGVVTVSIGVATVIPNADSDVASRLVQQADDALYAAKRSGRDRVRQWSPGLTAVDDTRPSSQ